MEEHADTMTSKSGVLLGVGSALREELIGIRHHLHAHPELSFQEHATSAYIAARLEEWGIPHKVGVADTGIVVDIQGAGPGRCIALRGDMDALPIHELNDVPYRSKNEGVMHACGHDVHSTCLLGALRLLWARRADWSGHIRGIFQPGEEKFPGGAKLMIEEGVLEGVDAILALHVFPDLPVGKIGFRPGMYMASADEVHLRVIGKGGHAAMPHETIDPVAIAAQLITALQLIVSRHAPPTVPSVLSFGYIRGDGATNVIPDHVDLKGTFRTLDEAWREKAHALIKKKVEEVCTALGGRAELNLMKGYPFLQNDETLTADCTRLAKEFLGADQVADLPIRMTGEDFAFYSQKVPACFFRLGTSSGDGRFTTGVHNPHFDIDDRAIAIGSGTIAELALGLLNQ